MRGTLQVDRELWDDDIPNPDVRTTYEYIINVAVRLKETCSLAQAELLKAQEIQKSYYDMAKMRTLQPDQKCFALLPTATNKLLAQLKDPYEFLERLSGFYYITLVDRKRKRLHI